MPKVIEQELPLAASAPADARPDPLAPLLDELGLLIDAAPEPGDFFRAFLHRLLAEAGAQGGAIWQRTPDNTFTLAHAVHWERLGLESIPDGAACHAQVLQVAAQRERALWVPPHSGRKLVADGQQAANLSPL